MLEIKFDDIFLEGFYDIHYKLGLNVGLIFEILSDNIDWQTLYLHFDLFT